MKERRQLFAEVWQTYCGMLPPTVSVETRKIMRIAFYAGAMAWDATVDGFIGGMEEPTREAEDKLIAMRDELKRFCRQEREFAGQK